MKLLSIKSIIIYLLFISTVCSQFAFGSVKTGLDGEVTSVKALPSGKILLGGNFETIDAVPARNIVKVDSNGTIVNHQLGNELASLGRLGHVRKSLMQADGKLVIVFGPRPEYNGESHLVRLLDNGQIDLSFEWQKTFKYEIKSIAQRTDGRLLIGFANYGNKPDPALIQLNADGTVDPDFKVNLLGNVNSVFVDNSKGFISLIPHLKSVNFLS